MDEFCFETVMSTERNIKLLEKAKQKGYFIHCYYILTADPMINVLRVKSRVESGGHDVPEAKIITRYDNSGSTPFRIFKKRKELVYYDECVDWYYEDIQALTDINHMVKNNLN